MARLHEYQGKKLLRKFGINVPVGKVAANPDEVKAIAEDIGKPVVLKAQVWSTKRASAGGIVFVDNPHEAYDESKELFELNINNFPVEMVLVEERLDIEREFFASITIDDAEKKPVLLFSSVGGSGIEEIARFYPDRVAKMYIDVSIGLRDYYARELVAETGIRGRLMVDLADMLVRLWNVTKSYDAKTAEINPIVLTKEGNLYAVDCRITIDDYSVYRHPELGIEVAREFDHPPTGLEKIAYNVEKNDYRGTFYFVQLAGSITEGEYIGFHGAGGGGSMMSMDAVMKEGFKIANFTDTSGNPSASKVYRAAKIILSQKGIVGYFGSGSGVASQEQTNPARGLVKAFREDNLSVPAVIRLGGNQEDEAVDILMRYTKDLSAPVEGYKKDDSADFCARRLRELVDSFRGSVSENVWKKPEVEEPYVFRTLTGRVIIDHAKCRVCSDRVCLDACKAGVLREDNGVVVLAIDEQDVVRGRCTECLACELACEFEAKRAIYIELPIPGLDEYRERHWR